MESEGIHGSVWSATAPGQAYPRLEDDLEVDVAVVGGGIVGITTAYLLQQRGRSVALVEADAIVGGVSGKTTAKVTSQHGVRYRSLVNRFGTQVARDHARANQAALALMERLVEELDLDVQWTRAPSYVFATDEQDVEELRQEAETCQDLDLPASFVTQTELPFPVAGAVRFEAQAHFHPRRFLLALASRFVAEGGRIFERSPVTSVDEGRPCTVKTEAATVRATDVVVATNVPINDRMGFVTRMKPIRAYGIAVRVPQLPLEGMYISSNGPVRSVRPSTADGPMLIVVGENHPVGHGKATGEHREALVRFAREHFPVEEVAYHWSTQDFYPTDGLPMIGRMGPGKKHLWAATGFQGWGMTTGLVAATLFADELTGTTSPWSKLYDPFKAGRVISDVVDPAFLKTQSHVASMFVKGRLRDEDVRGLAPGDGDVADVDGEKVAVHRDLEGRLHARSAVCTHMGCIVNWNRGEQSWDCGCHGSRFDREGKVLHGPATRPLAEASPDEVTAQSTGGRARSS